MKQKTFSGEWKLFKDSFRLDRRFWFIMLWEVVLIIAAIAGLFVFSAKMSAIEPAMMQVASQMQEPFTMQNALAMQESEQLIHEVQTKVFTYTAAILAYLLLVVSLFKSVVYSILVKRKFTAGFFGRFLLANIVWTLILLLVFGLLNALFMKTLFYSLGTSVGARIALLLCILACILIFSYFTIMFFLAFARTGRVWKSLGIMFRNNILGIGRFLRPLVLVLGALIALNVVLRITDVLPDYVGLFVDSVLLLAFFTWLKFYYDGCLERALGKGKASKSRKPGGNAAKKRGSGKKR